VPPSHTCLLEEEEEELDYNDSPAIVVEDNPEDVTGATAGFLEGRGSQEKGKRVQLRSIAVKPPGHRVSYKETLRLSPTIPPIQLSPNILFTIFYYLPPKDSSPYNFFSPTIPPYLFSLYTITH